MDQNRTASITAKKSTYNGTIICDVSAGTGVSTVYLSTVGDVSCTVGGNIMTYVNATINDGQPTNTHMYTATISYTNAIGCTCNAYGADEPCYSPVGSATITPTQNNFSITITGTVTKAS